MDGLMSNLYARVLDVASVVNTIGRNIFVIYYKPIKSKST